MLSEEMLKAIKDINFIEPTKIQEKIIPLVLEGKDLIGSSSTGSGKTLAFGAGIITKIKKGLGLQALILTPTRELAEQVNNHLKLFSRYYNLEINCIYGGVPIGPQIHKLTRSEIIVGTPGRILDLLGRRALHLEKLKFLVLDEADKMLDMGFIDDVERIINACPKDRQTLLFSATISQDIEQIAKKHMKNPVYVQVESYVDSSKLKQVFYDVPQNLKFSLLIFLLKQEKSGLIMIFCNTRRNTDLVTENLKSYGFNSLAIHGGLSQNKRTSIMKTFHSNQTLILVCTDIAARGIDVKNISHVYNYDSPKTSTEYIHRIGRTARAGNEGIAINLISPRDYENFRKVSQDDSLKIKNEPLPELEQLQVKFNGKRNFGFRRKYESNDRESKGRGHSSSRGRFSNPRNRFYNGGRRSSSQFKRR